MERDGDGVEQIRDLFGVCRLREDETLKFPESAGHPLGRVKLVNEPEGVGKVLGPNSHESLVR